MDNQTDRQRDRIPLAIACTNYAKNQIYNGWTENAGPENGGPKKMKDGKMQEENNAPNVRA